jgi:hypothetical protein
MTVDEQLPQKMTFPAPIVPESTMANPTMVEVPPVHAAKVIAEVLYKVSGVACVTEPQSPDRASRAYPV